MLFVCDVVYCVVNRGSVGDVVVGGTVDLGDADSDAVGGYDDQCCAGDVVVGCDRICASCSNKDDRGCNYTPKLYSSVTDQIFSWNNPQQTSVFSKGKTIG